MIIRNALWAIFASVAVVLFAAPVVGQLEGRVYPVVGAARIEQVHKFEDGWTYFSMSAFKRRDCNWRATEFFLGKRGDGNVPVAFEHLDRPEVRTVGELFWPESRVQLTPEQLQNYAHADTSHDCGWWFWLTRTPLYDTPQIGE